jgi:protein-disulfide isomerase
MEVEPQLIAQYVETGKARLIYRHLAQIGPESFITAEAMHCAGEQGKYWDMRRTMYERQNDLYGTGSIEGALAFIAGELGVEQQQFASCLSSHKYQAEVQADIDDSIAAGVRGRPVFEINGQRLVGSRSFENFAPLLDTP